MMENSLAKTLQNPRYEACKEKNVLMYNVKIFLKNLERKETKCVLFLFLKLCIAADHADAKLLMSSLSFPFEISLEN